MYITQKYSSLQIFKKKICLILSSFFLMLSIYSCIPQKDFPVFIPKNNQYGFKEIVITNGCFDVFLEVSAETVISDTNYIIPIEIRVSNYKEDTLHVKIKEIKSYLKTDKNEIYEGVVETSIDTMITNLYVWEKIPFNIEFKTFNTGCLDYRNHKGFAGMHSLEIIVPEIIINDLVFLEKKAFFLCK